ncbi:MAG TPA: type I-C CRISPR-associated protein Cas8c/Csd1, partial [Methanomassiliicoccaceae archaeon]|nr:type I-C CRISPR-associated protein Cas8c/Csd1 [Methanomassiliicoccaceae archaeon]
HHHQRKLSTGLQIARNRLIQEIMSTMQEFPTMLSLEQQGIFYIGYYHQRQDFFTSKNQNEATVSAK